MEFAKGQSSSSFEVQSSIFFLHSKIDCILQGLHFFINTNKYISPFALREVKCIGYLTI